MRLRLLRCMAPESCVASYFGEHVVDNNRGLASGLSLLGACTILIAPLFAMIKRVWSREYGELHDRV